jgi:hypothetical protein
MANGEITTTNGAVPTPLPVPRKGQRRGSKPVPQALATLANAQVEAEIANVRAIVGPAAEAIVELHAAVPYIVHQEALTLLEARMPQIEQENAVVLAECAEAGRSAVTESRAIANEFLAGYGLEGI